MILRKPTMEELEEIKKSYAEVVRPFKDKLMTREVLIQVQNALNENAISIYDKFGRIILKVGNEPFDYLDITSPKATFYLDAVQVNFTQTDSKGVPQESLR